MFSIYGIFDDISSIFNPLYFSDVVGHTVQSSFDDIAWTRDREIMKRTQPENENDVRRTIVLGLTVDTPTLALTNESTTPTE